MPAIQLHKSREDTTFSRVLSGELEGFMSLFAAKARNIYVMDIN
jgi:hypothetical protein